MRYVQRGNTEALGDFHVAGPASYSLFCTIQDMRSITPTSYPSRRDFYFVLVIRYYSAYFLEC